MCVCALLDQMMPLSPLHCAGLSTGSAPALFVSPIECEWKGFRSAQTALALMQAAYFRLANCKHLQRFLPSFLLALSLAPSPLQPFRDSQFEINAMVRSILSGGHSDTSMTNLLYCLKLDSRTHAGPDVGPGCRWNPGPGVSPFTKYEPSRSE